MNPEDRYDRRIWDMQCRKEGLRGEPLGEREYRALDVLFLRRGGSYLRLSRGATYEARLASKLAACLVKWRRDQEDSP